jgi:hypothetical protein
MALPYRASVGSRSKVNDRSVEHQPHRGEAHFARAGTREIIPMELLPIS